MKKPKPLTRKQYMARFSRSARWQLSPLDAADAIADYHELVYQEERDESKLVEELGDPVQAAWLLTDAKEYKRWLKVFAVLAFGLLLLAKWAWMGHSPLYFMGYDQWWYPVWVMAVGLPLSLFWFRRHGQKSGPVSKRLIAALVVVLVFGVGMMMWNWFIFSQVFLEYYAEIRIVPWHVVLQRELIIEGGVACALIAFVGLILARCCDRRWLALYVLALTVAVLCAFVGFFCRGIDLSVPDLYAPRPYLFTRLIPVGIVGLAGTGVALC